MRPSFVWQKVEQVENLSRYCFNACQTHDKFSPSIQQIFTDTENTVMRLTVMPVI